MDNIARAVSLPPDPPTRSCLRAPISPERPCGCPASLAYHTSRHLQRFSNASPRPFKAKSTFATYMPCD
ncbi:uncharacterized protein SETTUDRAFT_165128 [Exserohilum turcica Et28A]|uniref:Uncharacterized protein n=1 Tax=Exserohilum turcicum (strain 28A) TaxID=671987 RepID=R0JZ24_EXST2|nr:uncharacterized protein SETTUDRAFT_165128 [Exserohilum turcica Et28A]EOA82704.1 hypothetical protein SETTUDRAFT_165128 [Exserohilum turcica Et28A]